MCGLFIYFQGSLFRVSSNDVAKSGVPMDQPDPSPAWAQPTLAQAWI